MSENWLKSLQREIIARKTLDFLLEHVDESDIDMILYTIEDGEEQGYNLSSYRKRVDELRRKYK